MSVNEVLEELRDMVEGFVKNPKYVEYKGIAEALEAELIDFADRRIVELMPGEGNMSHRAMMAQVLSMMNGKLYNSAPRELKKIMLNSTQRFLDIYGHGKSQDEVLEALRDDAKEILGEEDE